MKPVRYLNWDGLLNTGASDFLMQESELVACKNVWVYQVGRIEKVPGYEKASSSQVVSSKNVNYLHWYYDTANSVDYLLAFSDEGSDYTCKYIAPDAGSPVTNWTTIGSISTSWNTYATSQVSVVNYLGKAFMVGHKTGSTFLPNATIDGTTFSTSDSDITDMPEGKYIVRYRDLLYVLYAKESGGTVYPSRAYYCDEPSSGSIGWTPATNFIEFGYDDGDEITGGAEALDRLVVFKHFSMWKYDESSRQKLADVGCDSFRSIDKIGNILYWFNRDGFYRWTGGQPELISGKAKKFIDAIDQTKLNKVVATRYHSFEYRAYIGDVTVDGITYNNAWFCWDTKRETCYIRCTYHEVKSATNFVESGKRRAYFGNDNGYVYKFANKIDEVYTDDSNDIDSFFITRKLDHGQPENSKFSNHITTFTKYGNGIRIAVDKDAMNQFGEANVFVNDNVSYNEFTSTANRYSYKFYEKGNGKSWELEGFVIKTDISEEEI